MRKIFSILFITLIAIGHAQGQKKAEYGIFLGTSYYLGELNPSKHFIDVANPSFGLMFRNNFNARYALRFNATYGKITGSDEFFDIGLNNFRSLEFESSIIEAAMMLEFNFYSFGFTLDDKRSTPYITVGVAGFRTQPDVNSVVVSDQTANYESYTGETITSLAFPFGMGMRWMLGKGINLSVQWTIHKAFNDKLDGIDNQYDYGNVHNEPPENKQLIGFQKGNLTNNDWYSFAGIVLSYRVGPKKNDCWGH